jgi:hypothetical protein
MRQSLSLHARTLLKYKVKQLTQADICVFKYLYCAHYYNTLETSIEDIIDYMYASDLFPALRFCKEKSAKDKNINEGVDI